MGMGNIMGQIGPWLALIVFGGFILAMIVRGPWAWVQIIAGMLFLGILYGHWPNLPAAINTFATSVVHAFGG